MQYNKSDSQALFWCFVFIILRMASQTLCSYVLWDSKSGFLLNFFFFSKIKDFVLIKFSYKKECILVLDPFYALVSVNVTWKHHKTSNFLLFSRVSIGRIKIEFRVLVLKNYFNDLLRNIFFYLAILFVLFVIFMFIFFVSFYPQL